MNKLQKQARQNKGTLGVVSQATPKVPTTTPQVFHMTSADFRNPAYDFRAFENWIAQVSGKRALQDAVNVAHELQRQALMNVESAANPNPTTTPAAGQSATESQVA